MDDELSPGEKLALALDMFETGVAMKRAQLRRRLPNACDETLDREIVAWLLERGDSEWVATDLRPRRPETTRTTTNE